MAGIQITWTPNPGGSARSISFDAVGIDAAASRITGNELPIINARQTITDGGKPVTLVTDSWWEVGLEIRSLKFPPTEVPTDAVEKFWKNLYGWISHARRGETFHVVMDYDKDYNTTTDGAISQGDVTINVDDDTDMTAGDWFYIEDADDVTVFEKLRIDSVTNNGGAGTITLESGTGMGVNHNFVDESVIRYHEYWRDCVLLDRAQLLTERAGGQGAFLWDLDFTFRTTR